MLKTSDHFSREAKLMLIFPILLIGIGLLVAIFGPWLREQRDVDRCLDAGGKYQYETKSCLLSNGHLDRQSREN